VVQGGHRVRGRRGPRDGIQRRQRLTAIIEDPGGFEGRKLASNLLARGRREVVDGRRAVDGSESGRRDCGWGGLSGGKEEGDLEIV
jgi:hypothetical protein